jgi:transcriptional regulator with XRE-family HTH domain
MRSLAAAADKSNRVAFGRLLRAHRVHVDLTIVQLARQSGVSCIRIIAIEAGEQAATEVDIQLLSRALAVSYEELADTNGM